MKTRVKHTLLGACAILMGLLAAEAFLRLLVPREIAFKTWYTPGIHRPDDKYGFVFSPNYQGVMHHTDRVGGVPLKLDEHGFRLPVGKGDRQVVLMGGRSMAFSYGLSDTQSIHGQLSRRLDNVTVRTTAWPGFGTVLNWHVYRDRLEPHLAAQTVILCFYRVAPDLADAGDGFALPPPLPRDELFHFFPDLVMQTEGKLAMKLGPAYYQSYVGHRLLAAADKWFVPEPREESDRIAPSDAAARFAALLNHVHEHFRARGVRVLVAFLPQKGRAVGLYEPWADHVPQDIPRIDLHRMLISQFKEADWIASGHYGPRAAEMIAEALAERVEALPDGP